MTTCKQSTEKRKKEKKATMVTCLTICSPKNCSISSSIMFLSKNIRELEREYNSVNDNIMKVLG